MSKETKQTTVEWLSEQISDYLQENYNIDYFDSKILEQAKEMEKEQHEKFNKFLNDEKQLGISDLKTIERIQWYYNTYFNETYGGNK
jgi:hypothetical protein